MKSLLTRIGTGPTSGSDIRSRDVMRSPSEPEIVPIAAPIPRLSRNAPASYQPAAGKDVRMSRRLFDHLVGECGQCWWDVEPERLGSLEVDRQFEFDRRLGGEIGGFGSLQDAIDVGRRARKDIDRVGPVRHQAAFLNMLPIRISGGNALPIGRPDDGVTV